MLDIDLGGIFRWLLEKLEPGDLVLPLITAIGGYRAAVYVATSNEKIAHEKAARDEESRATDTMTQRFKTLMAAAG